VFLFLSKLSVYPNLTKKGKLARTYDSKLFRNSIKEAFIGFIVSERLHCLVLVQCTSFTGYESQYQTTAFDFFPLFFLFFSFFFFLRDNNPNLYTAKLKLS